MPVPFAISTIASAEINYSTVQVLWDLFRFTEPHPRRTLNLTNLLRAIQNISNEDSHWADRRKVSWQKVSDSLTERLALCILETDKTGDLLKLVIFISKVSSQN